MITTEQLQEMVGAKVFDSAGEKIGSVGQVYLDETDGRPSWVSVRTGLFGTNENFVPLDRDAQLNGGRLTVSTTKDMVKDAPQVEPESGHLSEMSAAQLYRYYNMPLAGRHADNLNADDRRKTLAGNTGTRGDTRTGTGTGTGAGTGTGTGTGTRTGTNAGPNTDAMSSEVTGRDSNLNLTRYEEQLRVNMEQSESGRVRLRKHVVTEEVTTTVPVSHEEVRIEREAISDTTGEKGEHKFADEEAEVVLHQERVVVSKESVPVERVGLVKETRTEQQSVSGTVRKEKIDIEDERDPKRKR